MLRGGILLFPVVENYDYYNMPAYSPHLPDMKMAQKWHNITILQMENENYFQTRSDINWYV